MIFALLQLRNGLMSLGSRSLRSPSTGFLKTATRSELDVSGAKSPTKMLNSLGYCGAPGMLGAWKDAEIGVDAEGTVDAQLKTKGLDEFGMVWAGPPLAELTWESTADAWAMEGKVRKQ